MHDELRRFNVDNIVFVLVVIGRCWRAHPASAAAGLVAGIGQALEVGGKASEGQLPRLSREEAQAAEKHGKDGLIGGARRQMDFELGFKLDNAGGDFDQT